MMSVNPVSAAGLPYSPVCQIIETFPNGRTQGVSGFMVDKTHVLTAGHAVYNAAFGGWITSATVTPDCQGNGAHPYGQAKEVRAGTFNSWVNWSNAHRDGSSSPDACDIGISVVAIVMWRSTVFATYWGSMGSVCAT
jgi:V8-like Glu-specific endopeptidase